MFMKKVLITGVSGMLGATLVKMWSKRYNVFATDCIDFSRKLSKNYMIFDLKNKNYKELIEWVYPDIIIHCAAITDVDYCENNPGEAMIINGESVRKFIEIAPATKLIYISTDAVFPHHSHLANENLPIRAENIYGKSKEYGESFIKNSLKITVLSGLLSLAKT